jgi:hypothetical protein
LYNLIHTRPKMEEIFGGLVSNMGNLKSNFLGEKLD